MYTGISKRKEGSPCKNSYKRCFETTNFDSIGLLRIHFVHISHFGLSFLLESLLAFDSLNIHSPIYVFFALHSQYIILLVLHKSFWLLVPIHRSHFSCSFFHIQVSSFLCIIFLVVTFQFDLFAGDISV